MTHQPGVAIEGARRILAWAACVVCIVVVIAAAGLAVAAFASASGPDDDPNRLTPFFLLVTLLAAPFGVAAWRLFKQLMPGSEG